MYISILSVAFLYLPCDITKKVSTSDVFINIYKRSVVISIEIATERLSFLKYSCSKR